MSTYFPKEGEIQKKWYLVDANGQILGRLATFLAQVLMGKTKPVYTSHEDVGDFVVVVNADKIEVTGKKRSQKIYRHHSGYPGGFRSVALRDEMAAHPARVLERAVRGMLPRNTLGEAMYRKLKVYGGPEHPHAAQMPVAWDPSVQEA